MQGLFMLHCVASTDDDIITNIINTRDVTDSSSNYTITSLNFSAVVFMLKLRRLYLYRPR